METGQPISGSDGISGFRLYWIHYFIYQKSYPKLFWSGAGWWRRISEHPFIFASSSSSLSNIFADLWFYLWPISILLGKGKTDF